MKLIEQYSRFQCEKCGEVNTVIHNQTMKIVYYCKCGAGPMKVLNSHPKNKRDSQ